jgi:hypothetical protein
MDDYKFDDTRKKDILRIFTKIKKSGCVTFPDMNASIREKYFTRNLKIEQDPGTKLFYVLVDDGKKLFYKRGMDETSIKQAFNSVSFEQDFESPHRYLTNDRHFIGVIESNKKHYDDNSFGINKNDVVIDAGAAEGNFALSVIDTASKIYLIESDPEWCEALTQTFLPYKEKVEIIQKNLSDTNNDNNITISELLTKYTINKIDFLKMDIEGYEKQTLYGALINKEKIANITKMAICVYHKPEDELEISNFLSNQGYKFYLTKGYMILLDPNPALLPIRKTVLRAYN